VPTFGGELGVVLPHGVTLMHEEALLVSLCCSLIAF